MNKKAKFITLEGIEGVGKSSNVAFMNACLTALGKKIVQTREPGGTPLAENIRQVLLKDYVEKIDPKTELLLLYAGRLQHVENVIRPALNQGHWVISDRFVDASFAYQGGGREMPFEMIAQLNQWVLADFKPDYTIILDAPVETAFMRIAGKRELDRIEKEKISFFSRVRAAYLDLAKRDPHRYFIVNAAEPLERVQAVLKTICEGIV